MTDPGGAGLPEDVPLVAVRRGAVVESVHRGRFAFCDPEGNVLEAAGDPEAYLYARSSAKPLQALPLVLSGAADAFGLSDEELAVACASHNAEESHLAAVRSILDKAGLSEDDLQSGAPPPQPPPEARNLLQNRDEPPPHHRNCSRKHPRMLPPGAPLGLDTGGYRRPDHPLQVRILELLAEVCGLDRDEVLIAGDNCGVPAFALPLRGLAIGFARIATGRGLSDEVAWAAQRLRDVMRAHPFMVAGTGRFDTEVMGSTDLVTKGGAEAVFAAGSPEGWGMVMKISDGGGRAVRPAALTALAGRGVDVPEAKSEIRGLHGEVVGELEPLLGAG